MNSINPAIYNKNKMAEMLKEQIDRIILELINEAQVFNFEKNKNQIYHFIDKVKNKQHIGEFDNPFYHVIAGNVKITNLFDDNTKNKWKDYFTKYYDTDGVWSQRNFNKNLTKQTTNRTLNYYLTIEPTKDNIIRFWNALPKLDQALSQLSDAMTQPISYKTHRLLDGLITHNDSLKIYYYNPNIKNEIDLIVNNWLNQNKIVKSQRTHTFGVDTKGNNGQSFGQIIADKVAEQFKFLISTYGNKYTNDQYYQWIVKYLPVIIEKIKPKEFQLN